MCSRDEINIIIDKAFTQHEARDIQRHVQLEGKFDNAFARIEPYIKKAEDDKKFYEGAEKRGKKIVFWGSVVVAIGVIISSIKYLSR